MAGCEKVQCAECDVPFADIQIGALVIRSRHHGTEHKNVISLEWLERKLKESRGECDKIDSAKG
jgi:hypothetical protein